MIVEASGRSSPPALVGAATRHSPRVAVIGARGIGKQHAKWFYLAGCEVVAFAGINRDLSTQTAEALRKLFPFDGRAYDDAEAMLRAERPQIVVVASPHHLHLQHLRLALEHDAHVYLEKPFVWDNSKSAGWMLEAGRALLDRARQRERFVAMNTQYVCAWEAYQQFVGANAHRREATSLFVEMESKNLGRNRRFDSIWVDLGSHPISMLLALVPGGRVVEHGAEVSICQNNTIADFVFADDNRELRAHFRCGSIEEGTPKRRFGLEGVVVDSGGRNDETGIFRAVLRREHGEMQFKDFMHESIGRFVKAVREEDSALIAATGADGLRNLEIHLQLTDLAKRQP